VGFQLASMSGLKFKIIRYSLLAYVLLTLWQVIDKREDFPLSSFPMFAQVRGFPGTTGRTLLVGVNEHGEMPLEPGDISSLMGTVRLQKIFQQLQKKSDADRAEFMRRIARVLSHDASEADPLWALRFYTETWRTQLELKGIDHPSRELEFAGYIPPPHLLQALAKEAKTGAPSEEPRPAPNGDLLVDLDASACAEACTVVGDPLAAGGHALRLAAGGSLHASVPNGYALLVRMRTQAKPGDDRLALELDGKRSKNTKEGIGNYKQLLPFDAWVWASVEPGWPALRLKAKHGDTTELVLRAGRAPIDVDEIWLSHDRSELPIWNARLTPAAGGNGT
jgi:hypothetical protein